jgi:hypothetical protein
LRDYFIELVQSCETISNHEKKFSEILEIFHKEIKQIQSNLNVLEKSKVKQEEKQEEPVVKLKVNCQNDLTKNVDDKKAVKEGEI